MKPPVTCHLTEASSRERVAGVNSGGEGGGMFLGGNPVVRRGSGGLMGGEEAIRKARLRRGSGHRSARAVPQPPDVRSVGPATALWRRLAA